MDKEIVEQAKRIPIEQYLLSIGHKPLKGIGSGKYFLYRSMLRNENVPSFCVDKSRNMWKDMGVDSKWDDVISLVRMVENLSFVGALNKLLGNNFSERIPSNVVKGSKPGLEIMDVFPLRNPRLFAYLKGRGVDIDIARIYCEEAIVKFPFGKDPEKKHSYIAFRNDKGGYELRNHYGIQMSKVSSRPKYFTRIAGEPDKYNLFEGFIDFLTLLGKYQVQRFRNTTVVLNSLVNIAYLYQTLEKNDENNLFLDNDEAADKYIFKGDKSLGIKSLKEMGIEYIDRRELFKHANDINDYVNGKLYI